MLTNCTQVAHLSISHSLNELWNALLTFVVCISSVKRIYLLYIVRIYVVQSLIVRIISSCYWCYLQPNFMVPFLTPFILNIDDIDCDLWRKEIFMFYWFPFRKILNILKESKKYLKKYIEIILSKFLKFKTLNLTQMTFLRNLFHYFNNSQHPLKITIFRVPTLTANVIFSFATQREREKLKQ